MKNFEIKPEFNNEILDYLNNLGLTNLNLDHQMYTLNHKQAFIAVELALKGSYDIDSILHDTDKLVLYGVITKEETSKIHLAYSTHHINNCRNQNDIEKCIIDYECARFTKKDKPLNAYNTIFKYVPFRYVDLKSTLIKFNINSELNASIDFTKWNHMSNDELHSIISENIKAINNMNQWYQKFGEEKAEKLFYGV